MRVSIHAPAWGATLVEKCSLSQPAVSIHAPAWGATGTVIPCALSCRFQSTRPRGARPEMTGGSLAQQVFQSTRPRGARPLRSCATESSEHVSIHAPAWGATRRTMTTGKPPWPFQSTRPRGARQCKWFEARTKNLFQSTRPRGARHTVGAVLLDAEAVSIHAPAWGATGQAGK